MMRALLAAELRRVIADVAEALHDEPLAFEAADSPSALHVFRRAARFAQRVHQPAAGRFAAAVNAAFGHRLCR